MFERRRPDARLGWGIIVGSIPVAVVGLLFKGAIETTLRAVCEQLELKPRVVFGLVRVAVTGSSISPGLFESVHLLGRDEALARLSTAAARLA